MQGSLSVVPWSLVRGPKVPPLAAFHDIPPFCVFHDTCELFWENAHSSEWNVNSILVCIHLSLPVSGCKQISLMQCTLKLSTYLVRPGKEIACVGCRRSVQQQTCLVSAGLVLEKHMRPLARWKMKVIMKVTVGGEGHCCSFQLRLIDEHCSRLAPDVLVASHHSWEWIHSSSLSCEFLENVACVGCRGHCWSNMVREGCISKSFRALKKHPPLTLRQLPMKAHFNGKGRPNEMIRIRCKWPESRDA